MKKSVTIIDVGPTHMSVKALIVTAELKRRGVRFCLARLSNEPTAPRPRQAQSIPSP
jgi:hypothetical protein